MSDMTDRNILEGMDLLGFAKVGRVKTAADQPKRTMTAKIGIKPTDDTRRTVTAKIGKPPAGPKRAVTAKIGKPPQVKRS